MTLTLRHVLTGCALVPAVAGPAPADVIGPGGRVIECYCTDSQGLRKEMGEVICLDVGGRMFTAQCQMSLNVPMWRELHEGCATSALPQSRPLPGWTASGQATAVRS